MDGNTRILLIASASFLLAGQALAHSHLKATVPAPDSIVNIAPPELQLTFSEAYRL